MPDELWLQVEELFAQAVTLPPPERPSFLDRATTDPDLRSEVERLLAADASAGPFIERAIERGALALARDEEVELLGQKVGEWRLASVLGQGGMGTVYLAEPAEPGQVAGQPAAAAVKVLRRGLDTQELLSRFRAERRILANLEHPNIARFLDGGSTEAGLPYFVMERIEGQPIDHYCDERRLPVRERVVLFLKVCAGVQWAHRNLVVHRDLKPGNVLVTAEGEPKLLDFGIAKLLAAEPGEGLAERTATLLRLMTPSYASPEQILGEPVTPASDVYSLGVLLFELATGRKPFAGRDTVAQALAQATRDEGVERASVAALRAVEGTDAEELAALRGTSPPLLARQLRGDLDTILAKALARRAERRYGSAGELAADLDRYLRGLPIAARPDTFRYRASKFLRRHPWGVGAATTSVALVLGFLVAANLLLARTRAERDRATRVAGLLQDLFSIAEPSPDRGRTITAQELLDQGAERISGQLREQPDTQASLLATLGDLYEKLGLYDRARSSVEQALSVRRASGGDGSAEEGDLLAALGRINAEAGDFKSSEEHFRQALELRQRLYGEEHPKVATSLNNLGLCLHDRGLYAEARELYLKSIAVERKLYGEDHPMAAWFDGNLALLLHDQGEFDEAERIFRRVLAFNEKAFGPDSEEAANTLDYLGMTVLARGRLAEAEALLRRCLAARERLFGEEHRDVARSLCHLGMALREQGRQNEALPMLQRALARRQERLGPNHPEVAEGLQELAAAWVAAGEPGRAEPMFRRAIEIYEQALSPDYPLIGVPLGRLAALLVARGDCAGARPLLERAIRLLPAKDRQAPEARKLLAGCGG